MSKTQPRIETLYKLRSKAALSSTGVIKVSIEELNAVASEVYGPAPDLDGEEHTSTRCVCCNTPYVTRKCSGCGDGYWACACDFATAPECLYCDLSRSLVCAFGEMFDELEPETPEEIGAALREFGYDPEKLGARMKAVAEQALEKARAKHGY